MIGFYLLALSQDNLNAFSCILFTCGLESFFAFTLLSFKARGGGVTFEILHNFVTAGCIRFATTNL